MCSNRVFTEGTCKLLNLVISDLVDEDAVVHGRRQAVSALVFGTVAFLSKPGQTLAPLIGTWLLAVTTGYLPLHCSLECECRLVVTSNLAVHKKRSRKFFSGKCKHAQVFIFID